jgi:hypothetical protein
MARKTKAELAAEREAEQAQRVAVAKATYTERMMAVLERAAKENFELEVRDGKFRVEDRDDRRFSGTFYLPPAWDTMADVDLFQLEMAVELKEEARAEREQKAQVRATALAKLTAEEREELGL